MRLNSRFATMFATALVALLPTGAQADDDSVAMELSLGFLAGGYDFTNTAFAKTGGSGDATAGLIALSDEDQASLVAFGTRYDIRFIFSPVRVTVGFDVPGATRPNAPIAVNGEAPTTVIESIDTWGFRLGLGVEIPFAESIAPFIDLNGTAHSTTAELLVGGERVKYEGSSFGFSLKGGARVPIRDWLFVQAAGEVGIASDLEWSAEVLVGVHFGD